MAQRLAAYPQSPIPVSLPLDAPRLVSHVARCTDAPSDPSLEPFDLRLRLPLDNPGALDEVVARAVALNQQRL